MLRRTVLGVVVVVSAGLGAGTALAISSPDRLEGSVSPITSDECDSGMREVGSVAISNQPSSATPIETTREFLELQRVTPDEALLDLVSLDESNQVVLVRTDKLEPDSQYWFVKTDFGWKLDHTLECAPISSGQEQGR
jgi:hypothetical protein